MVAPQAWKALALWVACIGVGALAREHGRRAELADRRAHVRRLLDGGLSEPRLLVQARFLAERLAADFADPSDRAAADGTLRLAEIAGAAQAAGEALLAKQPLVARDRLMPFAGADDAPAVVHFLLGRALLLTGQRAAGEAELAQARALAPDAPVFARKAGS